MSTHAVTISPGELAERIRKGSPLVLLDVRLAEDYECGRLPGAKNNCVFEVVFLDRLKEVAPDRNTPVCVYGTNGGSFESRMAAEKFCRENYAEVLELRDGIEGWKAAGHPLEGERPAAGFPQPELHGSLEIDLEESRVEWIGRNLLNRHHGFVGMKSGHLELDRGRLVAGEFVLDMKALSCSDLQGNPLHDVLIGHLCSDDFFDVERFPEARFVVTHAEHEATPGAANLAVRGELTIKGVTRPVEFAATAGVTAEGKLAAQAALFLDRTLWNVIYGSGRFFRNLGGHLVNDLIEIQLRVVTR